VDVETGRTRRLTRHAAYDEQPDWSPDGRRIAFASARTGSFDVYAMNADGSEVRRVVGGPDDEREPAWSPDGTMIAFDRVVASADATVLVVSVAGGKPTELASCPSTYAPTPDW
jgi:TolB protein